MLCLPRHWLWGESPASSAVAENGLRKEKTSRIAVRVSTHRDEPHVPVIPPPPWMCRLSTVAGDMLRFRGACCPGPHQAPENAAPSRGAALQERVLASLSPGEAQRLARTAPPGNLLLPQAAH